MKPLRNLREILWDKPELALIGCIPILLIIPCLFAKALGY